MADRHTGFDAERLFLRKAQHCGYRFCPLCAAELSERRTDAQSRMVCSSDSCDFVFYQNPVPAAGAVIVRDEQILLVRRAHPPKPGWWCLPAGFMEWQEHPAETAVREVAEETGLEIALTEFFEVYSGDDDPRSNAVLILYLAEIVGGRMTARDDADEVAFFHLDQLPERIAFVAHNQALADYNRRFREK